MVRVVLRATASRPSTGLRGGSRLKWNITDGLTAFAQYIYFDNSYRGSYYAYGERNGTPNNVSLERNTTETREQTIRDIFTAHLNYNKTFRDVHTLNVTGGYEYMSQNYWKVKANAKGASSDDVPVLGSGSIFTASNQDEKQAMISYFARASYNYDDRYIVSGTFRADGSSKFAVGNQWGYFPAGSVAWVISEEPFWRNAKKTANTFKLRASYGQTGNNGIGLYDAYGAFATGTYHGHTTLLPSAMANSALKWETTTQLDLGMDLGFFGDRLRFVFDYYNKHTDNMLFSISVPDTGPYSSVKANVGSARFYGVEVELSSVNIRREHFSWTTDITYSFTRNKVLSLPGEYAYDEMDADGRATVPGRRAYRIGGYKASESGYRFGGAAVGEPLGRIYGYKIDHIIQTEAEADAALYDEQSNGYRVGDGRMVKGRKDAGDYEWRNRKGSARRDGEEIINDEDQFYTGQCHASLDGRYQQYVPLQTAFVERLLQLCAGTLDRRRHEGPSAAQHHGQLQFDDRPYRVRLLAASRRYGCQVRPLFPRRFRLGQPQLAPIEFHG